METYVPANKLLGVLGIIDDYVQDPEAVNEINSEGCVLPDPCNCRECIDYKFNAVRSYLNTLEEVMRYDRKQSA